jgi:aspartyl-tRNA(Asn)/glutamyl-tRNA(Gln) amidotransferase subunit A
MSKPRFASGEANSVGAEMPRPAHGGVSAQSDAICRLTLAETARELKAGRLSPVEVTSAYLSRIAALNPTLHAFITVMAGDALSAAKTAEQEIAAGDYRGPLHGVPLAVKDIIDVRGQPTTCGAKFLKANISGTDAPVVQRLRREGAILIGKTTVSEFAMGDDINPYTGEGPTRNPWNLQRSTYGSSAGSAAAVAAALCAGALGSDTAGSIRHPSAYCGIVGMKTTYAVVSTQGVTPLAWSLDSVGPMTRTVEDNALLFRAMTKVPQQPTVEPNPRQGIRGKRLGICNKYFLDYSVPEVAAATRTAAATLERLGARIVELDLPSLEHAVGAWFGVCFPEFLSYHQQYLRRGLIAEYGPANQEFLAAALHVAAVDYLQAQRFRRAIVNEFDTAFRSVDAILAPSAPIEAHLLSEEVAAADFPTRKTPAGEFSIAQLAVQLTGPANLAGLPSLQVPMGLSAAGLPLGLQMMGRPGAEEDLYVIGAALEGSVGIDRRLPMLM